MNNQEPVWDKLYKSRLSWKKETANLPNIIKGKSVLELGVGNGKTLLSIIKQKPKSVTAIDISEEALNKAKESISSNKVQFIKANLLNFQADEKFDIIVCYYVLNNLRNAERKKAAMQIYDSLKKGGIVLFEDFAVGDFRENKNRKDGLICHFFAKSEIKSLFKSFNKIKISERISFPFRVNKKLERKIISAIIKK